VLCSQEMAVLGQETLRVLKLQETLSKKLDMLESHQGKVHATLIDMEAEAQKLFEQEAQGRDAVDNRRLELFDRAIGISESLSQCAPCMCGKSYTQTGGHAVSINVHGPCIHV
jgi:hypothetical protein